MQVDDEGKEHKHLTSRNLATSQTLIGLRKAANSIEESKQNKESKYNKY